MKTNRIIPFVPAIFLFSGACSVPSDADKPNILFILADDLGYGDLACYNNPYLDTPVLDRLAEEGILLTQCYSASPLSAPSRGALLTGRYNHRTGAIDVSSNRGIDRMALKEKTMGDYFRNAGYTTGLIGKWHSGIYNNDYLPHNRGFDLFYGFPNGVQDYWEWNLMRNGKNEVYDGRYLTDVINQEAIKFIENNRNNPFLLFLSHHTPHTPFQAPDSLVQKYLARNDGSYSEDVAILYAMIEAMDTGLGWVFDKLDELDLSRNTLIVFTSDNGGNYRGNVDRFKAGLSGNKDNVLELGIRVPGIVTWKGKITPETILDTPVTGTDWLPTFFSLTGEKAPQGALPVDGINMMPLFLGKNKALAEDRILYFQKNRYTPVGHSDGAIRNGKWKLFWPGVPETIRKDGVRDNISVIRGVTHEHWEMPIDYILPDYADVKTMEPKLFNLEDDPAETTDLASDYPSIVEEMHTLYDRWFDEIFTEWEESFQEIIEHDIAYWKNRPIPDPKILFEEYWNWNRVDASPETDDPLKVFRGYWDYY